MTIEAELARIASALEVIAGGQDPIPALKEAVKPETKTKPKTTKKVEEPAEEETGEDVPKEADVRKALGRVQKAYDADKARELLREVGEATVMRKLAKTKYAALILAADKLVEAAGGE